MQEHEIAEPSGNEAAGSGHGLALSKEWVDFQVTVSEGSTTRQAQLTSLRNKIKRHADSNAHQACVKIERKSKKKTIESQVREMGSAANEATCRPMRIAYHVAYNDRPFSDFEKLVDLEKSNGVNLGIIQHRGAAGLRMNQTMADEMKRRVVSKIQENECYIAVSLDVNK